MTVPAKTLLQFVIGLQDSAVIILRRKPNDSDQRGLRGLRFPPEWLSKGQRWDGTRRLVQFSRKLHK
jgi:hypothetical protein